MGDEEAVCQFQQNRSSELLDCIVQRWTPAVVSIAHRFRGGDQDLRQEGFVGLLKAVHAFDPERGASFATYVHHKVSGELRHYLRDYAHPMRLPRGLREAPRMVSLEASYVEDGATIEVERAIGVDFPSVEGFLDLAGLLSSLRPKERKVAVLVGVLELPQTRAASLIGCSQREVSRAWVSARAHLAQTLLGKKFS